MKCPLGKYGHTYGFLSEKEMCRVCRKGTYSTKVGVIKCENCPGGKYGLKIRAISEISGCRQCPSGKYGNMLGAETDSTGCKSLCPGGKYGVTEGHNRTTACKDVQPGVIVIPELQIQLDIVKCVIRADIAKIQ